MVKTSKSLPKKKAHEDRNAVSKISFDPINIETKSPNTVVLVLASDEESVLLQALSSLNKFAAKSEQNVVVLYHAQVFEKLIPLLSHSQLFVKRFAIKLLSEMCFCPEVRDMLLKEKCFVKNFMEYLKANEDLVLKEFSASIVAQLTKLTDGYVQLIESGMIDVLLPNLLCSDPDVQKNCLEIVNNMLKDPFGKDLLIESSDFNFTPLLDLISSEYPAIQNLTLDALTSLTEWRKDNFLQELFLKCGGVQRIIDTIEDYEIKDIHSKCLNVLSNVCDNPMVLETLHSSGANTLLRYMDNIHDTDLRLKALRVVLKLGATSVGRKVLLENEILDQIVPMILEESIGISSSVCYGLINLIREPAALRGVVENNVMEILFAVIKQESRDWDTRGAAVSLLYEILQRDINCCLEIVEANKQEILITMLMDPNDHLPVNVATSIANCLAILVSTEEVREKMVDQNLVKSLLNCFKERAEDTIPLRIAACNGINALLCNADVRNWIHMEGGLEQIWNSLTNPSTTLRLLQVAANLIYFAIVGDKTLACDLYRLGAFSWLLENKSLRNECPAWEVALEVLFNNFLPLKFAYTGRLDLTDVTYSSFYITRSPIKSDRVLKGKFPDLKDLLDCGASPCEIVYVINFESPVGSTTSMDKTQQNASIVSKTSVPNNKRTSLKGLQKKQTISTTSASSKGSSNTYQFCKLEKDDYLCGYLERLKEELNKLDIEESLLFNNISKEPSVVDGKVVQAMAEVIAKFVSNQMCGPDSTQPCTAHTLELHLTELKLELGTCIFPIGYLRVGLYLERALLFKALADQVGLPCCLVRGHYCRSWIEVALPEIPPPPRPFYPSKLLRPNFIVDLMLDPGRFIPLNSHEAGVYCKTYE